MVMFWRNSYYHEEKAVFYMIVGVVGDMFFCLWEIYIMYILDEVLPMVLKLIDFWKLPRKTILILNVLRDRHSTGKTK
jgi:hypothetical protein